MFEKIKDWYRALPDKKKHVEFFTAILTVPVLLTVLMINLANINNNKKEVTPTPAPTKEIIVVTEKPTSTSTITTTPPECKKEVGTIKITTPAEGQLVNTNTVCLKISYQVGEYCSVVWSYRVDNSDWSDFTDKEICIYNMTSGPKELELKVKSSQSDDEITLIRNFYYKSKEVPTPTSSPTTTPNIQ
ncbi:MAG: hypothetical protein V1803_02990 [Candidatus Roizmanbacteria bacterium]